MLSETEVFERLERTVTFIAQHPDYPGKQEVVADFLDDIDERWQQGGLSLEQKLCLYAVLMRSARARPPLPIAV